MNVNAIRAFRDEREAELERLKAELERLQAEFGKAQDDIRDANIILSRHSGKQTASEKTAAAQLRSDKSPGGVLSLAQDFSNKPKYSKIRRALSETELLEVENSAKKLIESTPKSTVLYLVLLWMMQRSKIRIITVDDALAALPAPLRALYNDDEALAKENLRSQLRKKAAPYKPDSDIAYDDGVFKLMTP